MSELSIEEYKELKRLRGFYRQRMDRDASKDKWAWATSKGIGIAIISYGVIRYFTPDTVFGRSVTIFGMLICFAMGILSSYYGPFADKQKESNQG